MEFMLCPVENRESIKSGAGIRLASYEEIEFIEIRNDFSSKSMKEGQPPASTLFRQSFLICLGRGCWRLLLIPERMNIVPSTDLSGHGTHVK